MNEEASGKPPEEQPPAPGEGRSELLQQPGGDEAATAQTGPSAQSEPEVATAESAVVVAAAPAVGGGALPSWVPYFAVATVASLIVGILVYVFAGGGGGGGSNIAAGVVDGFIRRGSSAGEVNSFAGRLPPQFPRDFPLYRGSEVVVSFSIPSSQGTTFFAILSTSASPQSVYDFYLERLDRDPWQVEAARSSDEFTALAFSRPDNADVQGEVNIHRSDLDGRSSIYITFQDLSLTGSVPSTPPFVLGASRPLPPGFPSDIPIYKSSKGESVVLDTIFQRGGGGRQFYVSFLTRDSQDQVVSFYRQEFQKRGWTVTDSAAQASSFVIGIDFNDGQRREISGSVSADAFEADPSYVRVDIEVRLSGSRGRGN